MPTYRMTLEVYTEADNPTDAAAEFLNETENADVSFVIVETVASEDAQ